MQGKKALIKHELRGVKYIFLYFLTASIIVLGTIAFEMKAMYIQFLRRGIQFDQTKNIFLNTFYRHGRVFLAFMLAGIVLLTYFQFKDIKQQKIGRFLKSLPFQKDDFLKVKVSLGILSYTIPTIIFTVGVIVIRYINMVWLKDFYSAAPIEKLLLKAEGIEYIVTTAIIYYLIITVVYLFLLMMQYIVNNRIAAIVIGTLVFHAPAYILISCSGIYRYYVHSEGMRNILFKMQSLAEHWGIIWFYGNTRRYRLLDENNTLTDAINNVSYMDRTQYSVVGIENITLKIVICIGIILLLGIALYFGNKNYKIEYMEQAISFEWARKVFVIGVTICSAFVLPIIKIIFFDYYIQLGFAVVHTLMIIGAVVGYFIARKIAYMGVRK
ncbi:MAG: hypothetical protein AB9856_13025 [Cellulosilyticaceae bacterium]